MVFAWMWAKPDGHSDFLILHTEHNLERIHALGKSVDHCDIRIYNLFSLKTKIQAKTPQYLIIGKAITDTAAGHPRREGPTWLWCHHAEQWLRL